MKHTHDKHMLLCSSVNDQMTVLSTFLVDVAHIARKLKYSFSLSPITTGIIVVSTTSTGKPGTSTSTSTRHKDLMVDLLVREGGWEIQLGKKENTIHFSKKLDQVASCSQKKTKRLTNK